VLALEALVAHEGRGSAGGIHTGVGGRGGRGLVCVSSRKSRVERNLHVSSSSPSVADPAGRTVAPERLDVRDKGFYGGWPTGALG
jgi:hypothetical protein